MLRSPHSTPAMSAIPHLPALRKGRPYESLDKVQVKDHKTGEICAEVSQVNAGIVRKDLARIAEARKALKKFTVEELIAITAKAGPCGEWPEDLVANTMENRNYHNFGCATQANLAAQVANPMDLVQPRGMTPIDAEQRYLVIQDYREVGQPILE